MNELLDRDYFMIRDKYSATLCSPSFVRITHSFQAFDVSNFCLCVFTPFPCEYVFLQSQSGVPSNSLTSNYHSCNAAFHFHFSSPHTINTHPLVRVRTSPNTSFRGCGLTLSKTVSYCQIIHRMHIMFLLFNFLPPIYRLSKVCKSRLLLILIND